MTNKKIEELNERVDAIDHSQPGRKKPKLMGEIEGEAWIHYCISLLTEEEKGQLDQTKAELDKTQLPHWKDPSFEQVWNQRSTLHNKWHEILMLGEARAEAGSWEPWLRFEAEYRDGKTQLAKVKLPIPDRLIAEIKRLSPEEKTHLLKEARQDGISEQVLRDAGLTE